MAVLPGVGNGAFARALPPRPRLPILDAYILREMAGPFMFGLGAFFLFWFVNIFFVAADYLIKGAPAFLILRFLLFRVPQSTPLAFPFACLFGTLLAFGRLTADNEIAALRTSGVSFWRIVRLPLIIGFAMFLISYEINERIAPGAVEMSTRTFYQIIYKSAALPIEPHLYRQDPMTQRTFLIDNVEPDHRTMDGVAIFAPPRMTNGDLSIDYAKRAYIDGSELVLIDPVQTRVKGNGLVSTLAISAHEVRIPLPLGETGDTFFSSSLNDPYTMDSKRLAQDIKFRKATGQGGSNLAKAEMTLAQKLANPFASFIAVVIALPLAVRFGKKGRTIGIALSILVLFLYFVLTSMTGAFGSNGVLDPYLAAWIPNGLFAIAASILIAAENK